MKTYKVCEGMSFDARAIRDHYGLACLHRDTLEGIRGDIDRSNARAVEQGFSAQAWQIVQIEWKTVYDDTDLFVESEEHTRVVEIYPPELNR